MSEHVHRWELSDFVIDTYPETLTWWCNCGYGSHDGGKTIATCCGQGGKEEQVRQKELEKKKGAYIFAMVPRKSSEGNDYAVGQKIYEDDIYNDEAAIAYRKANEPIEWIQP